MRIIFKNVGLGDSIILEWSSGNSTKYGIIDCNRIGGKNPTLEFIQAINPNEIEFIILTHFHFDHYSGLPDFFDYCAHKKIIIRNFYHTLSGTITQIAQTNTNGYNSNNKKNVAFNFLTKLSYCMKNQIIEETLRLDNKRNPIKLNEDISIKIYAPQDSDHMKVESEIGKFIGNLTTTVPDINKLSTILKIENGDEFLLLTSDSTKSAISRIKRIIDGTMLLGQVPHHGSRLNHNLSFWTKERKEIEQIAVFSVGYDLKNKLPNQETVKDLNQLGYKILATNQVFGLSEEFGNPKSYYQGELPEEDLGSLLEVEDDEVDLSSNIYDDLNGDQVSNFW